MCNRKRLDVSVARVVFLICIREVQVSNLGQRTVHRDWGYLWYSELCLVVGFGIGVGPSRWLLLRSERGAKSLAGKNFLLHGLSASVTNVKQWLDIPCRHTKMHKNDMIAPNPDNILKRSLLFDQIPSVLTGIGPVLTLHSFRHHILNAYFKFVY